MSKVILTLSRHYNISTHILSHAEFNSLGSDYIHYNSVYFVDKGIYYIYLREISNNWKTLQDFTHELGHFMISRYGLGVMNGTYQGEFYAEYFSRRCRGVSIEESVKGAKFYTSATRERNLAVYLNNYIKFKNKNAFKRYLERNVKVVLKIIKANTAQ